MFEKVKLVLGINQWELKNPDGSYILTVDNVIKMFAIHMKFRYMY